MAVVVFGPDDDVLVDFTKSKKDLDAAVAKNPSLAEGTHIYDALTQASKLAKDADLPRATVVLLSDGTDVGSDASRADALEALDDANIRVISVGLKSKQYDSEALRAIAQRTGGAYVESATPTHLAQIFGQISSRLSSEYTLAYRSLLPPQTKAIVRATVAGMAPASATYTTPTLDFSSRGTFDRSWIDSVIVSPFLMVFIVVSVVALLAFAILTAFDVRSRSVRRRMALYVSVPTEEESSLRRAEVASMLASKAHRTMAGQQWWQKFEKDVELSGLAASAVTIAGWTLIASVLASLVTAIALQNLLGLFAGLAVPFVTQFLVSNRVSSKRTAFGEQLPDNLEVMAGALRAGHSLIGAMNVMVEGADEPSKSEFRRVLQDEQLGIPVDQALAVTSDRMANLDIEQVAIVTRLQREAGGNTAEVLDRVVENIRGRMEIRRLIRVLTAQGRLARWVPHRPPARARGLSPLHQSGLARSADEHEHRTRIPRPVGAHAHRRVDHHQENRRDRGVGHGSRTHRGRRGPHARSGRDAPRRQLAEGAQLAGDARPDRDVRIRRGGCAHDRRGSGTTPSRPPGRTARRHSRETAQAVQRGRAPHEAPVRGHVRINASEAARVPGHRRSVPRHRDAVAARRSRAVPACSRSCWRPVPVRLGWTLPMYYVNRRRRLRFEAMDRQMPDMIDLLVVTIEAGLGILASMRVAAESLSDPLGQELRLTLQEQRMGLSVNEAIESLRPARRLREHADLRSLADPRRAPGVSIGTTMRNLALEMRKRRKAMVEEQAQKIPIKMLFPLAFLIFPAMFIVLLVPAFIQIFDQCL